MNTLQVIPYSIRPTYSRDKANLRGITIDFVADRIDSEIDFYRQFYVMDLVYLYEYVRSVNESVK